MPAPLDDEEKGPLRAGVNKQVLDGYCLNGMHQILPKQVRHNGAFEGDVF